MACANDLSALGFLDGLRRSGVQSPNDVLVLGYDNIGMDAWAPYGLSSFDQNVPEMIRRTLRLILDGDAAEEARRGVLETVPARLVARRTTARGGR